MLNIYVGELEGMIRNPSAFFDNQMDPAWFDDPFVKRICKEVDNTDVVSAYQMSNPIWGPVNCRILSTGVKNLILADKTDEIIYATCMGDNCSGLLLEIADRKDLTVALQHIMHFPRDFTARILNTDVTIHSLVEYTNVMCDLL